MEAEGDGGALVDRDMAGIRRVFQLLVEDIMEEVEVLADEDRVVLGVSGPLSSCV